MFNLVQIQEQLKGLPLPAVMQYANGSNPEVPPYIALTELNRRKQMEQAASVQQPPNQTVADQVKQGAMGMMQMAAQQEQAQQGAAQPQPSGPGVAGLPGAKPAMGFAGGSLVPTPELVTESSGVPYSSYGWTPTPEGPNGEDKPIPRLLKWLYNSMAQKAEARRAAEQGGGASDTAPTQPDQPTASKTPRRGSVYGTDVFESGFPASAPTVTAEAPVKAPRITKPSGSKAKKPAAESAAQGAKPNTYKDAMDAALARMKPKGESTPEELAAQVKAMMQMFGIKEPGEGQDSRISQMERIIAEREAMFEKQKDSRSRDKIVSMLSAYAQAPRGRALGVAAAEGARVGKEQKAADLANMDTRLAMSMKMAELRELNEAKQQAFRQGNMALYLQKDAEQKAAQRDFNKMQLESAGKVYTTESQREGHLEGIQMQGENALKVAEVQGRNQIAAANVRAGAGGQEEKNALKLAQLRAGIAQKVEAALTKDMNYQIASPAQQEAIREQRIEAELARALQGRYNPTAEAAPTASPKVIDFGSLKK